MSDQNTENHSSNIHEDVKMVTSQIAPDKYRIVAKATFESTPEEIWELLWDWEQLLAVGLPGITSNFQWLSGSPDEVPSSFQFEIAGTVIREEIYERSIEERYRLRYRTLEPALGILEYDAVLELDPITEFQTTFIATREVQFDPGSDPGILAGMVQSETQCLQEYFAKKKA